MGFGLSSIMLRWRRRWWRPDASDLAAFANLRPAIVITGGSEGIGLAFAHAFHRLGHDLLLVARNSERLEAAAREVLRAGKAGSVATLSLDITAPDALQQLDAKLAAMACYADLLVNNAGIGLAGNFADLPPGDIDALVALNIVALTRLCRHALPGQLIRGRGGIINMASLGGYIPGPQQAAYYASKAYIISLSEALAAETAGRGVHVLVVAPGPVETAFHAKMGADTAYYRSLLPAHSAAQVAASAMLAFGLGHRVAVPGLLNHLLVPILRLLPHRLTLPIASILLRPPAGSGPSKLPR